MSQLFTDTRHEPPEEGVLLVKLLQGGIFVQPAGAQCERKQAKTNNEALVRLFEDIHRTQDLCLRFSYSPLKGPLFRCCPAQVIVETLSQHMAIRLLKITAKAQREKVYEPFNSK